MIVVDDGERIDRDHHTPGLKATKVTRSSIVFRDQPVFLHQPVVESLARD